MKRLVAFLLLACGLLASPLRADVELSFDFFHDELSPFGEWAEVDGYGYVWHPSGVDGDWSPYTDGYWSYTDAGWTWVSYEDWGGICYHYGRWVELADYGWCWVPGYEWGPAWVSWRKNDDYIGWAPLPPECDWEEDRGIGVWVDAHYEIGPRYFSFCHTRDFGAPVLRHVLLPRIRNVEICFGTVNITNISYNRDYGCAFNGGFDYDYIRARCERPVPALKLVRNTTNIYIQGNRGNVVVNARRGNALIVAAPRVNRNSNFRVATRRPEVRRTFQRTAVTKGWAGLEKPETRDRLLGKMREETKGLSRDNAPARPVRREALAVVPKDADFKARPAGMRKLPAERRTPDVAVQDNSSAPNQSKESETRPGRVDRNGDGRPDFSRGGTAQGDGVLPPGRGDVREKNAPTAEFDQPTGLRKRRDAGETQPNAPVVADQPGNNAEKLDRRQNPRDGGSGIRLEKDSPNDGRSARQERAAELKRAAREEAARANAPRNARQQNGQENGQAAPEMQRKEAQENVLREKALRDRAQEAAAARRNESAEAEKARRAAADNRREAMAERQAQAQQQEAAQENARRQAVERQNYENQRRAIQERQVDAQRQRAAVMQEQQAEARARASEVARERAISNQRQQAAEANRARAMENHQRAAAQAQAQQAQARAQAQAQARAHSQAQAQAQQRSAQAQAVRRQPEPRQQNGGQQNRGNGKNRRGE